MRATERGNVLFYILIAVALLGTLSYAVTQSGRGNISQVSNEKARLLATEIIDYANAMTSAVSQLRLRGVTDTSLCFDDPGWGNADYDHAGCSLDENKVFHVSGGGLTWARSPAEAMETAAAPDTLWHIYSSNEVADVGTTCGGASCAELMIVVDELGENVCMQINDLLGVENPSDAPPTDSGPDTTLFNGSYGFSAVLGDEAGGEALQGKTAGCLKKTVAPTEYIYFRILLAR
jgi:hypothetical protein